MIKLFDNIKLSVLKSESELIKIAQRKLGAPVKYFKIVKKSLDARDKGNLFWVYSVAVSAEEERESVKVFEQIKKPPNIVIVGTGPAGLCCALRLVDHGFRPVIVERGGAVDERAQTIDRFFAKHELDGECNVQFGEGGAGTFSDGKLNTQTKDNLNRDVLEIFHRFGAPEEILYLNKPHIGSDKLKEVVKNIRRYITAKGGTYCFDTKFCGFTASGDAIDAVQLQNVKTGVQSRLSVDGVVLAIGHSARDTFELLHSCGVPMEAKEFAVGVRIEHLSREIGFAQYGKQYHILPAADYKLVSHAHERTVFTFCMCPGGVVIPAASEQGGVVTNGMSNYARDGVNSNSALMVQMRREDFGADDLFAGMRFQRKIEQNAFRAGGFCYKAPVQRYQDFAEDRISSAFGEVKPSYSAGVAFAPLAEVLPPIAVNALKAAIPDMGKRLKGFDCPDALLTGAETRFSSPVKILRDENCQSLRYHNLYPCGEGSGYSGGITSSAADGLKTAEKIFEKHKFIHLS